jgi:hypothetical protein
MDKLNFKGTITSIQPRIRLTRSFDEASHTYLGLCLLKRRSSCGISSVNAPA